MSNKRERFNLEARVTQALTKPVTIERIEVGAIGLIGALIGAGATAFALHSAHMQEAEIRDFNREVRLGNCYDAIQSIPTERDFSNDYYRADAQHAQRRAMATCSISDEVTAEQMRNGIPKE